MKTILETKTSEVDLNPIHASTMKFSAWYAYRYGEPHEITGNGLTPEPSMNLMCVRIRWALDMAGSEVADKFSEAEIIALINCCVADLFLPDQFNSVASKLCDHLGITEDEFKSNEYKGFFKNLSDLEAIREKAMAYAKSGTGTAF